MSDADDKLERIRLEELARLEGTDKLILQANEALILHELQQVLVRQAERDLVIDEIRGIVDTLAVGHVMVLDEIKKLRNAQSVLLRQQQELRERQDFLARMCDAFAEKLERESKAREQLVADVADRD